MRNLVVSIFCFCITVVALAVTGFDENNVYGKPKRESDVWGRGEQGAARIHGISCFCMGCQRERNKEREKELARVREDTESAFKYNSQQQRERCETYNDFKKELKRGVDGEPDVRGYRDFNSFRNDFVGFYYDRHRIDPNDSYTRTKLEKYARERWSRR